MLICIRYSYKIWKPSCPVDYLLAKRREPLHNRKLDSPKIDVLIVS